MHLYINIVQYARTANGIDFLDWTIFGRAGSILAAKVGPPGPLLAQSRVARQLFFFYIGTGKKWSGYARLLLALDRIFRYRFMTQATNYRNISFKQALILVIQHDAVCQNARVPNSGSKLKCYIPVISRKQSTDAP